MDNVNSIDSMEDSTQHIGNYLRDLRNRLNETGKKHNEIIQVSMNIIKEFGEVSTMLGMTESGPAIKGTKIRRLIMEFENKQSGDGSAKEDTNLLPIIADFRRLDKSQLLNDSLMYFKRALETYDQLDSFLKHLDNYDSARTSSRASHVSINSQGSTNSLGSNNSQSLRKKIQAFNMASEQGMDPLEQFPTCFRRISIDDISHGEELKQESDPTRPPQNSGCEGDMDNEQVNSTLI